MATPKVHRYILTYKSIKKPLGRNPDRLVPKSAAIFDVSAYLNEIYFNKALFSRVFKVKVFLTIIVLIYIIYVICGLV
jgi:hypothetical protein